MYFKGGTNRTCWIRCGYESERRVRDNSTSNLTSTNIRVRWWGYPMNKTRVGLCTPQKETDTFPDHFYILGSNILKTL